MIDPISISTVSVGNLPPADFNLTDNLAHEIGEELKRGTVKQLAELIVSYLGTSDSLAFNPTTILDGGTLPATTSNEWILVGKGTFNNVGGGSTITTTEELNALTSNGSYWALSVQIPINVELAGITQNIRPGFTESVPSEDAISRRLAEIISLIPGSQNSDEISNNSKVDGTSVTEALNNIFSAKLIIPLGTLLVFKVPANTDKKIKEVGDYCMGLVGNEFVNGNWNGGDENLPESYQ